MKSAFTLFAFFSLASYLAAQPAEVPPHTPSPDDVKFAANIFHSHCAECHGLKGEGGRGPDLTQGGFRHGVTDEALFRTSPTGSPYANCRAPIFRPTRSGSSRVRQVAEPPQ